MRKKIITALMAGLFGLSIAADKGWEPHHEPLISKTPPKPNIMMVLDTSGSMRSFDMPAPSGYDSAVFGPSQLNSPYWRWNRTNHYDSSWGRYTRLAVMQWIVLDLIDKYRHQANIGLAPLDYEHNRRDVGGWSYNPQLSGLQEGSYRTVPDTKPPGTPNFGNYTSGFSRQLIMPMDLEDDANYNNIRERLAKFPFDQNTPLNSPLYQASVLMRGYHASVNKSPIQYRCQQQHIILMTDGEQNEYGLRGRILQKDLDRGLRWGWHEWNRGRIRITGKTATLPNLGATFAQITDIISESRNKQPNDRIDSSGQPWDKPKANGEPRDPVPLVVHAIRFSADAKAEDENLRRLAHATGGQMVAADDTAALEAGFHAIFQDIIATRSGGGGVEDQKGRTEDSIRYATFYDSSNWHGRIEALGEMYTQSDYERDAEGKSQAERDRLAKQVGTFTKTKWNTENTLKPGVGRYISYQNGSTVDLDQLFNSRNESHYSSWLKGIFTPGKDLRPRPTPLGDIIDSHLEYAAKDRLHLNLKTVSGAVQERFIEHLLQKNRAKDNYNYLIAGSNDGLLSFIIADKASRGRAGERDTAYFPSFFKDEIKEIAEMPYTHNYKVNGTTHLFDTEVDGTFKTIGITMMGAGKEGLVGYELYSGHGASSNTTIKVNFEITSETPGFENLGYTYSGVEFINRKVGNKTQALAIFGNGYVAHKGDVSANQPSSIFIIDAVTGKKIKEIKLTDGNNGGGASTPAVVVRQDPDTGYQMLERLYVGDQSGNLYKVHFDTESANSRNSLAIKSNIRLFNMQAFKGDWDVKYRYPITTQPMLAENEGDIWIYFGTGRAILAKDDDKEYASKAVQSFFGLKDKDGGRITEIGVDSLVQQKIIKLANDNTGLLVDGDKFIEITSNPVADSKNGWYLNLDGPGERVIFSPSRFERDDNGVLREAVVFSTYAIEQDETIKNDPCEGGGHYGRILFLDLYSGGSSNLLGSGEEYSGIHSEGTATGLPTGPGMLPHNPLSGSTPDNDLSNVVIQQLIADNPETYHTDQNENFGCDLIYTGLDGEVGRIPMSCPSIPLPTGTKRLYKNTIL